MIQKLKVQFEKTKKDIEQIKIQAITDSREKERLQNQLKQIQEKIVEQFGVSPELFETQILKIQKQLMQKKDKLRQKIQLAKEKMK